MIHSIPSSRCPIELDEALSLYYKDGEGALTISDQLCPDFRSAMQQILQGKEAAEREAFAQLSVLFRHRFVVKESFNRAIWSAVFPVGQFPAK